MIARPHKFAGVCLTAFLFALVPVWALNPSLPPGNNFDLSKWKLQTPFSGTPEIKQPQLATYSSNIFYTAADGAMVFWVPTAGEPITAGGYPRTELREIISGSGGGWVITNNVVHTLTATCKVLIEPPNQRTIIGQIHGNGTGSEALKIYWNKGKVQAAVKDNYGGAQIYLTLGTWALGATLNYSIQESNRLMTITVNGSTTNYLLNSTWDNDTYYFKAGNYCQDNSAGTDTCVVAFYALDSTNSVGSVGAPAFSPAPGTYSSSQTVTISTSTMGTSIRYTTNGVTPTRTSGTIYSSPVIINTTTTLKAIAYDSLLPDSTITTGGYTIGLLAAIFSASPTNGGAPLTVTFTDTSTGTITNRYWNFGDGATMNVTTTSLTHTYSFPGTNAVTLIVSGDGGLSTNTQTNLIVAASVDTVGDGVPDWWRAQYFGGNGATTNADSSATVDFDNDGLSNLSEYLADTNPTNDASRLAVTGLTIVSNSARLIWIGGSSAGQFVEYRNSLTDTNGWNAIYTNTPPTAVTNTLFDSGAGSFTSRFYRIKAWR